LLAAKLTQNLQQTVIVENRPGASGIIGTEQVIKSAPDGRTLLLVPTLLATNVVQFRLNFDPQKDLRPVLQLNHTDIYLLVHAGLELKSLADLKQLAQSRPDGLNCGAAPGGMALDCEHLRLLLGGKVVAVPYAGIAPTLHALMAGQVDLAFISGGSVSPLLGNPRVRVLASGAARPAAPPLDNLPLLKDTWPGWVSGGFMGVFVPAGTPTAIVERLNREFNQVLADPEVRAAALLSGDVLVGGAPEVMTRTLAQEIESRGRTAQEAGVKPAPMQ
jgi:tripartite-type tricarboxylate transporter receptor subunit TctC